MHMLHILTYTLPPGRKAFLASLVSFLLAIGTYAPLWGQPPVPAKWHRIKTPYVDVIFKGNITREAQRIANLLTYLYPSISHPLGPQDNRFTLILDNHTIKSNAATCITPRRAFFFTFPPQGYNAFGTIDWLNLLTIHEFRHAAQFTYLQQNFNQLAYWLGGGFALSGMIQPLTVPQWFLEGDAVHTETRLTTSGRGRIPYFSLLYKTNLLTRKDFSYDKQHLASYKDGLPNCYTIGYHLTAYLQKKYGDAILAEILQQTTFPKLFTIAVKQATGKRITTHYKDMNRELKADWQQQIKHLRLTPTTKLHVRRNKTYVDYNFPQVDRQGNVIALKSGIGTVAQFVALDQAQREHKIYTPGCIDERIRFSTAQDQIVWVEEVPDIRQFPADYDSHGHGRMYRIIQRYDIRQKRLKTLTHKSRYGTAALSPDATRIVSLESDKGYNHQLVILDAQNGQILQRLPNPENHFYFSPTWSDDGKQIVVVKRVQERTTITTIQVATGASQDVLPYTTEHIGCPVLQGQYVLYNSAYSGIDNIYAIDLANQQRYQVTSSRYGAYNPTVSVDNRWLIYNDFSKDGMDVVKIPFNPSQWTPLEQVQAGTAHVHALPSIQAPHDSPLSHVPNHTYPIVRYYPWRHKCNVHSWLTITDFNWNTQHLTEPSEGLVRNINVDVLSSTDLLDTTELKLSYGHDFKEKSGAASLCIDYKTWYPKVSINGILLRDYKKGAYIKPGLSLTIQCPLTWMRGQYTHHITASTTSNLYETRSYQGYAQLYEGTFWRYSQKSFRDMIHPWKQTLQVGYWHAPHQSNQPPPYWYTTVSCHFPGLVKHHSLCLEATCQKVIQAWHRIALTTFPRENWGYVPSPCKLYAYYAFPIYYPDWGINHWLYVKRLYATVGYERKFFPQWIRQPIPASKDTNQNTVSIELLANTHLFTVCNLPQVLLGIKCSYHFEQQQIRPPVFYMSFKHT